MDEDEQLREGTLEAGVAGGVGKRGRRVVIGFRSPEIENEGFEEESEEGEEGRQEAEEEEEGGDEELLEDSDESVELVEVVFLGEFEKRGVGGDEEVPEEQRSEEADVGKDLHWRPFSTALIYFSSLFSFLGSLFFFFLSFFLFGCGGESECNITYCNHDRWARICMVEMSIFKL